MRRTENGLRDTILPPRMRQSQDFSESGRFCSIAVAEGAEVPGNCEKAGLLEEKKSWSWIWLSI